MERRSGRGVRRCSFRCDPADDRYVLPTLAHFDVVDPDSVRRESGSIVFMIDLTLADDGDGPAVELMIRRALEDVVSIKRFE